MNQTVRKAPAKENLAEVDILNGQEKADLIRDTDPDGLIVEHRIKRGNYVHERLYNNGKGSLEKELYLAAENFRMNFERGHMAGQFAKLNMFRAKVSRFEITDNVVAARTNVIRALDQLGHNKDGSLNLSSSIVWFVVGEGHSLEEWTTRIRWNGKPMDSKKATGVLIAVLERLALHYGLIQVSAIKDRVGRSGFKHGVQHVYDFIKVYCAGAPPADQAVHKKLTGEIEKRMSKFLEQPQ